MDDRRSDEEKTDLDGVDLSGYDYIQTLRNFRAFTLGATRLPAIVGYIFLYRLVFLVLLLLKLRIFHL